MMISTAGVLFQQCLNVYKVELGVVAVFSSSLFFIHGQIK